MKVCPDCGTEATTVKGRRRGSVFWWCWKCERHIRPVDAVATAVNCPLGFTGDCCESPIGCSVLAEEKAAGATASQHFQGPQEDSL